METPERGRGSGSASEHGRSRGECVHHRSRCTGAVRPLVARGVLAGRCRRFDGCRRRVLDAAFHPHSSPARPDTRGRVGRQRSNGHRSDPRPDRLDRPTHTRTVSEISCCSLFGRSDWVSSWESHSARSPRGSLRASRRRSERSRRSSHRRCGRLVRSCGHARGKWVPRRLSRRACGRKHPVSLSKRARRISRGRRVRRAGRALRRCSDCSCFRTTCPAWRCQALRWP